jgi:hypothetical protein
MAYANDSPKLVPWGVDDLNIRPVIVTFGSRLRCKDSVKERKFLSTRCAKAMAKFNKAFSIVHDGNRNQFSRE